MNTYLGDISIDCSEPERTREFYAALTGWERRTMYGCPALVADSGLVMLFMGCDFDFVSPVWPEEPDTQQKQMHLDFHSDNVSAAVELALSLGATKPETQYGCDDCVTLLDPEGHPFCLQRFGNSPYFEQRGYVAVPSPSINIDCRNTGLLREFYAHLTDWDRDFHLTSLVADNGTVVHFMQADFDYVSPIWPEEHGRQQKQMHINFQVGDLAVTVELALSLGATKPKTQYGGEHYVTLQDPDGHPFCLCRKDAVQP